LRAGLLRWAIAGLALVSGGCGEPPRKLIQFGWGEPDTAFMRRWIRDMESTPFDGCVYNVELQERLGGNLAWRFWGKRGFQEEDVAAARENLRSTRFRRFRYNFLRINVTPGDVDWFDDFEPVLRNARLAAELARDGRSRGVLLDTEAYQEPLFAYRERPLVGERSFEEYAAQARLRGEELMSALEEGYPGLTVFLTFGYSVPFHLMQRDGTTLQDCGYGLLAPFVDGLVAGVSRGRLVEGYELSYGYRNPEQFEDAYRTLESGLLGIVERPERYRRVTSFGFGLWMDYDHRNVGWHPTHVGQNYFTPEAFEASARAALDRSDEYVWIYTEVPRWWSEERGRISLPTAYEEALWRARESIGLR
jgi:hypothetical protein